DPEYGFFSPHSWWPLVVALGAATIAMGLVFAVWVIVLGGAVLLLGIVGWLFEYYRGEFAR
ncbi:MAG: cytochrome c oxidase subunit 4, partial [Actinomycetota bacterium]